VQPLLLKYAPEKLYAMQADKQRLNVLLELGYDSIICFLGNSGVDKSTLLNALAAGEYQILPAGGIGPLTAQTTKVRYSKEKPFYVTITLESLPSPLKLGFRLCAVRLILVKAKN